MSTRPQTAPNSFPPPPDPRWELEPQGDPTAVTALMRELNLPGAMCRVLATRQLGAPSAARDFLRPSLDHVHSPGSLPDAERAAERLHRAVREGETVFVHGDYDVDGICATALLTRVLRQAGGSVVPFVPHRTRDGYDLGDAGVEGAVESGASLLVTVDCGTRALAPVRSAVDRGIDVIVTDHHTPGDRLPEALAVVNPHRTDADYPNPHLCGTGVAFKLAQLFAGLAGLPDPSLADELDLVALATIADLVPLVGENRVLVRHGLKTLGAGRRPGTAALLASTGLGGEDLTAGRVGFVLAPRLNAAGRVGETRVALDLLLTDDPVRARSAAEILERDNALRREEDRRTLDEALAALAADYDPESDLGVVIAGEGWHPGVIGIVASRVVERIYRPTVMVSIDGDTARGSARSIPGFDLLEAVAECAPLLQRFGGHRQAAGMDLRAEDVEAFRGAFREAVRDRLGVGDPPRPLVRGDTLLELDEVTPELVRYLTYMGPFGIRNRRPVFFAPSVRVEGAREVGTGHLKLRMRKGSAAVDAIGFGLADRLPPGMVEGQVVDAALHLEENHYRGRTTVQARLLDLRPEGTVGP